MKYRIVNRPHPNQHTKLDKYRELIEALKRLPANKAIEITRTPDFSPGGFRWACSNAGVTASLQSDDYKGIVYVTRKST